jgi:hypothetical protein
VTESEAKQAVAIALAACPSHAAKLGLDEVKLMIKAWAMLLEDLESAAVMAALKRYLATSHWLPAPAQIRALVAEAKHGRRRPGADAWEDVRKAIGAVGRYRTPAFTDPLVARAVSALGWRELCDSENSTSDRARFVELYDQYASSAVEDATVGALPGVSRPALRGGDAKPIGSLLLDVIGEQGTRH